MPAAPISKHPNRFFSSRHNCKPAIYCYFTLYDHKLNILEHELIFISKLIWANTITLPREDGKQSNNMKPNKPITKTIKQRLEYLRGEIEAERLSYGELAELQDYAEYIDEGDVLLREWAGIPEFKDK